MTVQHTLRHESFTAEAVIRRWIRVK